MEEWEIIIISDRPLSEFVKNLGLDNGFVRDDTMIMQNIKTCKSRKSLKRGLKELRLLLRNVNI